jgi:transposase-like protein
METESGKIEQVKTRISGKRKRDKKPRFSAEYKLKAVKLLLEEGYGAAIVCKELGLAVLVCTVG